MNQTSVNSAPLAQLASSPARRIALIALGVVLITIGAKVQVPFWPVPMTLQTLAMMFVFAAGGLRLSLETILAYLGAGLAGLPVFAGAVAGPLYFAGPTGGFLIGFVFAAAIVGWAADRGAVQRPMQLIGAMLAAEVVLFALGFLWLGFVFTTSSGQTLGGSIAFANGVQPFILGDLVKIAIATVVLTGIGSKFARR